MLSKAELPNDPITSDASVHELVPKWVDEDFLDPIGGKLTVLSFSREARRQSKTVVVHTWSRNIPEGSFYQLKPHVFVASPEFVFLVAATKLPKRPLVALGDELCGLYSFDAQAERGMRQRVVPLTTKERLAGFLNGVVDCQGAKKAIDALRFVVERSGSPMETFDEMALCLPCRLGGYGLPEPEMNRYEYLTLSARKLYHAKKCAPDLGWFEKHVAVEHLGGHDHSLDEDALADRARVAALKEMGFEVVELTSDLVSSLDAFEVITIRLAGLLDKRIRKENLGPTVERLALRRELRAWNASYGSIAGGEE